MKAMLDGTVLAEADPERVVRIEGNWYFPPDSVVRDRFVPSPTPYTCAWKGRCQYLHVQTDAGEWADAAWSYPEPPASAVSRVGEDFSHYVTFDRAVDYVE